MTQFKLSFVVVKGKDGYTANCREFPEIVVRGSDKAEVLQSIQKEIDDQLGINALVEIVQADIMVVRPPAQPAHIVEAPAGSEVAWGKPTEAMQKTQVVPPKDKQVVGAPKPAQIIKG